MDHAAELELEHRLEQSVDNARALGRPLLVVDGFDSLGRLGPVTVSPPDPELMPELAATARRLGLT